MAKGIVIYYSRSGNTRQMAHIIADAMNQAGLHTDCKSVSEVKLDEITRLRRNRCRFADLLWTDGCAIKTVAR